MTTFRVARRPALGAYTKLVAGCTFLLLLAGAMVTSTGSGLAVPDWPLSFGKVMPSMEGGVFYEHGHRMVATFVGALIVVEALWLWRVEPRRWVRVLGWLALGGVILQGALGGITVLLHLPDAVSVSHAALAELVFGLTVAIAVACSGSWLEDGPAEAVDADVPSFFSLAALACAAIYLQILVGAVVRHTGAGLAIPTFPLAFGRLVPPLDSFSIAIHFAHRVGALAVTLVVAWGAARALLRYGSLPRIVRPALLLLALLALQMGLGAWVILSYKSAWVTSAHLGTGALLFATALTLALRSRRYVALAPAAASPPIRPHREPAEAL
jgi:heme a synthase